MTLNILLFVVAVVIAIRISYKRGYRKGARMVLDSWKEVISEVGNNDNR